MAHKTKLGAVVRCFGFSNIQKHKNTLTCTQSQKKNKSRLTGYRVPIATNQPTTCMSYEMALYDTRLTFETFFLNNRKNGKNRKTENKFNNKIIKKTCRSYLSILMSVLHLLCFHTDRLNFIHGVSALTPISRDYLIMEIPGGNDDENPEKVRSDDGDST